MMTVWKQRAADVRGRALDCGHFIPEEQPDQLIDALFEFFESIEND